MNQNRNLHSLTKLTEFARDFENEPHTLFSRFVNKIQNAYNQSYNTVNEISSKNLSKSEFHSANQTSKVYIASDKQISKSMNISEYKETVEQITSNDLNSNNDLDSLAMETQDGHRLINVLLRIRNLMASRNPDLREYKDTDLQRFWMPDSKAKECYDCAQKFSTFKRKHHCRLCGQIFCSRCCNQLVPGKIIMCSGDLKVCNYCSKIVLSYLKTPNITKDLNSDLQSLQQNLTHKLKGCKTIEMENSNKNSSYPYFQQKFFSGYKEECFAINHPSINLTQDDRKNLLQQNNPLISLYVEMRQTLPMQNYGTELIKYLNNNHKSSNDLQAKTILNAMLDTSFIQPITYDSEKNDFDDTLLYRFAMDLTEFTNYENQHDENHEEQTYSQQQNQTTGEISMQFEQMNTQSNSTKIFINTFIQGKASYDIETVDNLMHITASKFIESYCNHEEQLLNQILRVYQLDSHWSKVLNPICCRAANHFKPEYSTDDLMDIRHYVNFKKIPGGNPADCSIVCGFAFSKNVAHKSMNTYIEHPRILLLQCPIVYERIEGKFVSISTVLLQEEEYLRNVCARIMSFKPNVVLIHKKVSGVAQEMLRTHGITLVLDVKLTVMERLARMLQCDILTTIEGNIAHPILGTCDLFSIRSFSDGNGNKKTLMFFEKLANPRSYTCLLRGADYKELAKVKKVASFLLYARYNWRLEMSFLLNEFAEAITFPSLIFDSKENSPDNNNSKANTISEENESNKPTFFDNIDKYVDNKRNDRKTDDRVLTVVTDVSHDFSDPLRSEKIISGEQAQETLKLAVEHRYDNRFRSALSSTILSVSPFLSFPPPFLETEQGQKCTLRCLFPDELYYSKLWSITNPSGTVIQSLEIDKNMDDETISDENIELKPPHPFLTLKITEPIDNRHIQTLLAEFRSFGGRYPKNLKCFKMLPKLTMLKKRNMKQIHPIYNDALDIENHQRLPVLFCSFFYNQKGASSFCAPPTLLDMKFYGQHDIMLGQFLHRYCFRLWTNCTRCNLPMLGHIRRYVHSMGCVNVFLSQDSNTMDPQNIYFTAWCCICHEITPMTPLTELSKCLSLAKYLELRFHGHAYKKRQIDLNENNDISTVLTCQHSLHRDYVHQFSYRGIAAKFKYTSIETWEIVLPSLIINLHPPTLFDRLEILEEIKNFSMKGHDVYTRIYERIADQVNEDDNTLLVGNLKSCLSKDQLTFKQHIEIIMTVLTEDRACFYDIQDALLVTKRFLAESIERWENRLHEFSQKLVTLKQSCHEAALHNVDAGTICTEDLRTDHADNLSISVKSTESIGNLVASDVDSNNINNNVSSISNDKKTIKKMLNHLLPTISPVVLLQSPFCSNEHYTLPMGSFPIMVNDHDLSSIIAYSLTCVEYRYMVSNLCNQTQNSAYSHHIDNVASSNITNCSPQGKRKIHESISSDVIEDSPKDNIGSTANDEERSKYKINNSHIEINFQDSNTQFTCRIYFAREFDLMRAKTLQAPKCDNFIYKEIEQNKKYEELSVLHDKNGSSENESIHKDNDILMKTQTKQKSKDTDYEINQKQDEFTIQNDIVERSRKYFARCLSSSVQWEAKGGKSGSRFCKTWDDRFILKEMTKSDINIFENFAPNYFDYISRCQQQNHPTLLAKIFGVFRVIIKKKDLWIEKSLLVIENLFYGCDIKNKFDLKGSERNRLVDPMNQQEGDIVLLDENLVQMSWSKPLYILTHSKIVLKDTINRDACFLEGNQVMDYSLLVGLNEKDGSLILGIIDYIRTFTFERKVESFVKQTGILGGMGKLPTVVPPQLYRQRFADAMDRYFHTVPDRWDGLSKI